MAKKHQLRQLRAGTVINVTSAKQESDIVQALGRVEIYLNKQYPGVKLRHDKTWSLADIVDRLRTLFPTVDFYYHFGTSHIRPDGGIFSVVDREGNAFPILISEVKNQGTNDLRQAEGKPRQAKGNAIERLGKNVIGLRAAMRGEAIFPFVCFGYGCDFEPDSSILDRVSTIAMFGKLCKVYLHDSGEHGFFDRGSYFFRSKQWTVKEMSEVMIEIAEGALLYYMSKYGRKTIDSDAAR
ncbi:MAG: EcoRI family type II restriction endonuclease [Phycisphaeraceae bacterium]